MKLQDVSKEWQNKFFAILKERSSIDEGKLRQKLDLLSNLTPNLDDEITRLANDNDEKSHLILELKDKLIVELEQNNN